MRIVKKEKVDVKKFMEEMKANRTNRSYNSIDHRRVNQPFSENRPVPIDHRSKTSTGLDYHYQPPYQGNHQNYPHLSQMSQISQNSQNYIPNQMGAQFNHHQSVYSYQPQYGQNPYAFTNNLAYGPQPYPLPPPPLQHYQVSQLSQNEDSALRKTERNKTKDEEDSVRLNEKGPLTKEKTLLGEEGVVETEKKEKKNSQKKESMTDSNDFPWTAKETTVKRQLQEVILDQKRQKLEAEKKSKKCEIFLDDLKGRLRRSQGDSTIEQRIDTMTVFLSELANSQLPLPLLQMKKVEEEWSNVARILEKENPK